MKKTTSYQIKTFKVKLIEENYSHLAIVTAGTNHHFPINFLDDPQSNRVDQIVKTIKTVTNVKDPNLKGIIVLFVIETAQTQILETNNV